MKEYTIKTTDNTYVADNSMIIYDSITLDTSINSSGKLKYGLLNEKSIFKCTFLQLNGVFPNIEGKTINVKYVENGATVNVGDFLVDKCEYSENGEYTFSIVAYSLFYELTSADDTIKAYKTFMDGYLPYFINNQLTPTLYFDTMAFVQPVARVLWNVNTSEGVRDDSLVEAQTYTINGKNIKISFYVKPSVMGAYLAFNVQGGFFRTDTTNFISQYVTLTDQIRTYLFRCGMQFEYFSNNKWVGAVPLIINDIYDGETGINANIRPIFYTCVTGYRIEVDGNVRDCKGFYPSDLNAYVKKKSGHQFSLTLEELPYDTNDVISFYNKIATSIELDGIQLAPLDNNTDYHFRNVTDSILRYPSETLYPGSSIFPSGADRTVRTDEIISLKSEKSKPFGFINVNFSIVGGGSFSFVRKMLKTNYSENYYPINATSAYNSSTSTYTYVFNSVSGGTDYGTKMHLQSVGTGNTVKAFSRNHLGQYSELKTITSKSENDFYIEGEWVSKIRRIDVVGTSNSASFTTRDDTAYMQHAYSENDNVNTYDLSNDYLNTELITWSEALDYVDRMERKLSGADYNVVSVSCINELNGIKSGDSVEIHENIYGTSNENVYVINVNSCVSKGGQYFISDIKS